ncbi:MAG TPA: LLM class flavin-dependent oxidoreductase [Blastocatellia bacterium]|jgi:alkanesulfonate monooxygenase SsuD/methylene tetrahydromethanopterin reductase-like flavin-dependent oxidoreductase (luciferase family)|nr:LLM class flavin-dependent oxidoreductase [Blastocatellia bacterium]
MELGLFNMPLHPPGADHAETLEADIEQLVLLDRLGFAEAWIGEHFLSEWENIMCADLVIANALARTERIKLGTGVSSLPYHHPVMLAHRIALLDQLARGRFMWGIGSGAFAADFVLWEIDTKNFEQRQLTREALDTILMLWKDPEPGPYRHRRWSFTIPERDPVLGVSLHMRPYQNRPHPPIAVAGVGPRSDMLAYGGARGFIPLSLNVLTVPTLVQHWETYEESAKQAGRSTSRSIWRIAREVYVGETSKSAREEAINGTFGRDFRAYILPLMKKINVLQALKVDPNIPDEAVTVEYLAENIWIVGDVDEVAEKLYDMYMAVGGFGTLLVMGHEWEPQAQHRDSMNRLKTQVLPRLEQKIAAKRRVKSRGVRNDTLVNRNG